MKPGKSVWSRIDSPVRPLTGILLVLGVGLLGALSWVLYQMGTAPPSGQGRGHFDEADFCAQPPVLASVDRPGLAAAMARAGEPEPEAACWRRVTLPWREPASAMLFETRQQPISRSWFRMQYAVPALWPAGQDLTLFIPRAMGAAWQLRVGDVTLADNLDDWRMTWNRPVVVTVPARLLQPGGTLEIRFLSVSVAAIGNAVGLVTLGPTSTMQLAIAFRQYLQSTLPQAASAAMLLMGLFFFLFWWARPAESEYLLLAVSGLVWSVCNLQFLLPRSNDPALDDWYWTLVHHLPITWLNLLIYQFAMRFSEHRIAWLDRLLPWYVIAMSLAALPLWPGSQDRSLMMVAIYTGVGIVYIGTICWMAAIGRSVEMRVIAATLALGAAAGINDLLLAARWADPQGIFLLPGTGLLIYAAFLYAVQRRYVAAIRAREELSASLARQLAAREAELHANYGRLRELERTQEMAAERQRLMGEIQDGLGSLLTSSLAALQRGSADHGEVAEMMRECVDELRLVIDSLDPHEHDLVALLATLRFRMGRRIEAAGIRVEWQMDELPPMAWMGPHEALQLMRVLQEILANVVKHAQATTVRVSVRREGGEVAVRCADDGRGFDAQAPQAGRGLPSIARRCRDLGARLRVDSTLTGGTEVCIHLPLLR